MLKLYNTLTRKKEIFKPLRRGSSRHSSRQARRVGLYTCGPTVYNYAHIGNLRTYIFEDILQRTLEYGGYKVKRVMNITDVGHLTSDADAGEDKIEKEAKREKKSVWDIADFYAKAFLKDIKRLNIKEPELLIKATDTINEQIKIIKKLVDKKYAYETRTAIYFDISKFKNYGKLSGQSLKEKLTAAREEIVADPEKRNPADFALWFKLAGRFKNHIMHWPSPWGKGFPGWHIECSAISTKYLGQPFDIHTGGVDHIGTHHTNEIAQSEAAFGKPLAKFWLHGEFLLIAESRMAKSEGNFITLQTIIDKGFNPLTFRYLVLNSHYRSKLNFGWQSLGAAQNGLMLLYTHIQRYNWFAFSQKPHDQLIIKNLRRCFREALEDDLHTPSAMRVVHETMQAMNATDVSPKEGCELLYDFDQVLGLNLNKIDKIPTKVQELSAKRREFRANKQFTHADDLRKQIEGLGYLIDDTPAGPFLHKKR